MKTKEKKGHYIIMSMYKFQQIKKELLIILMHFNVVKNLEIKQIEIYNHSSLIFLLFTTMLDWYTLWA